MDDLEYSSIIENAVPIWEVLGLSKTEYRAKLLDCTVDASGGDAEGVVGDEEGAAAVNYRNHQ